MGVAQPFHQLFQTQHIVYIFRSSIHDEQNSSDLDLFIYEPRRPLIPLVIMS